MNKKWILMIASMVVMLLLVACGNKDDANNNAKENNNENISEDLPEADLGDLPDIVIEVNGEEITKDEFSSMYEQQFQQIVMQLQMSGQDVNDIDQNELKEQTAETLIGQNLLMQEAEKEIKDVSEDEINETIEQLLEQTGMESKDDLLAAFSEQGIDEKEFTSQVEIQVKVDQLIDNLAKDIKIAEEETKEAYETIKEQQEQAESEEEFPSFDDIKGDLEAQLMEQKKSEETNSFVEKLRKDADVKIHL